MNNNIISSTGTAQVINTLVKQVSEGEDYPYVYSVVYFGFYDNNHIKLPPSLIRKFWDKYECERTAIIIRNSLKETFGMDGVWTFQERHKDILNEEGEVEKKGKYHLNIITSQIRDCVIEEPNRKIRRLLGDDGRMGVPIKDLVFNDLDDLKEELVNACIRRASEWVNRFQYSVKTQFLLEPIDLDAIVRYCLKDYKLGKADFTDVVIFPASDFYKP
jgi:hypothetical protein